MATLTLRPNGAGNQQGWDAEPNPDYTQVDEVTSDGDTTRLYTPTDNRVGTFALENHTSETGTINSVTVYINTKGVDPVSNTVQLAIRTGGTDYFSADKTYNNTSYHLESNTWATNPNTGSAWTWSEIDALEAGMKRISGGGQAVTQVYVVVDYTSATLELEGFRWRNDDGSETTATWYASQDTSITLAKNNSKRLRMIVNATGAPGDVVYQLEHKLSGGSWSATPVGASAYGSELTTGGTASASAENAPTEGAAQAFDNNTSTKWLVFATTGWLQYRFGGSATHIVTKYALTSANDVPDRDPKDWDFQGSNNGTTWTTIESRSGEAFNSRFERREFTCTNSTAYEYYRLNITANNGNGSITQLGEFELYELNANLVYVDDSSNITPEGLTTVDNLIPNPSFENNITDGWTTYGTGTVTRSRDTTYYNTGSASFKIDANGIDSDAGLTYNIALTPGTYYLSGYVKTVSTTGDTKIVMRNVSGYAALINLTVSAGTQGWTRISGSYTIVSNTNVDILIGFGSYGAVSKGVAYFDSIQLVKASSLPSYFDGSTATDPTYTYAWTGTAHNSTSRRTGISGVTTTAQLTAPSGKSKIMKGISRSRTTDSADSDVTKLNALWWYDWWYAGSKVAGSEYVPMIWGDWEALGASTPAQVVSATGAGTLLGFNEPDNVSQSNMTVARALALWPSLEATGCRLGSPAVSPGSESWLASFMAGNPRVDFICVHWYEDVSASTLFDYLDSLHSTYNLPIWITEIGNLTGGISANNTLIPTVFSTISSLSYVERIAWFSARGSDGYDTAGLIIPELTYPTSGNWPKIWSEHSKTTGASATSVSNWGRLTTGTIGSYGDYIFEKLQNLLSADGVFSIDTKIVDTNEQFILLRFRANDAGTNAYEVELRPSYGNILLKRIDSGTPTTLSSTSFTFSTSDVIHTEISVSGSTIEIRVWKNSDSRPSSATLSASSATYSTQKRLLLGLAGGNASASRTTEFQIISLGLGTGGEPNTAGSTYASYGDYSFGRLEDQRNPAQTVTIANNRYTELEWKVGISNSVSDGDVYQFRVTNNGAAFTTYSVTPQWTVGTTASFSSRLTLLGAG